MQIMNGRFTSNWNKPVTVFYIGMRVNHFWQLGKWLPVAKAMPRMLKELYADPASGFLGANSLRSGMRMFCTMQYWRDFESLENYAKARNREHWPAWAAFNKAIGGNGSVGIFHETYIIQPGAMETIYANMPPFGLGQFTALVAASGSRKDARSRMTASTEV